MGGNGGRSTKDEKDAWKTTRNEEVKRCHGGGQSDGIDFFV